MLFKLLPTTKKMTWWAAFGPRALSWAHGLVRDTVTAADKNDQPNKKRREEILLLLCLTTWCL